MKVPAQLMKTTIDTWRNLSTQIKILPGLSAWPTIMTKNFWVQNSWIISKWALALRKSSLLPRTGNRSSNWSLPAPTQNASFLSGCRVLIARASLIRSSRCRSSATTSWRRISRAWRDQSPITSARRSCDLSLFLRRNYNVTASRTCASPRWQGTNSSFKRATISSVLPILKTRNYI